MGKHVALVGVDWADKKHAYEVRGADGRCRQGEFEQRPEGVHAWVAALRAEYPEGTIALAVEQSRGALLYALGRYEFLELWPVPPTRTAAYRRFVRPSGAKSDPIDAGLICDYVDKHGELIRRWQPADSITRELLLLVEWRRKLIEQRVGLSHQLRDTLKQYFPQALEWAGELGSPMWLDFLERWPTLGQLQRSRSCTVRSFYTQHGSRSAELIERRVAEIASASPLHTDQALLSALSIMVSSLVPIIRTLSEQVRKIDHRIAQLWTDHPDRELFESFPGAAEALAHAWQWPSAPIAHAGQPVHCRPSAASPPSRCRAERTAGSIRGGTVRSFCGRPFTSLPSARSRIAGGRRLSMPTNAAGARAIMPQSALWPLAGSASSFAAGKSVPLTTTLAIPSDSSKPAHPSQPPWSLDRPPQDSCGPAGGDAGVP